MTGRRVAAAIRALIAGVVLVGGMTGCTGSSPGRISTSPSSDLRKHEQRLDGLCGRLSGRPPLARYVVDGKLRSPEPSRGGSYRAWVHWPRTNCYLITPVQLPMSGILRVDVQVELALINGDAERVEWFRSDWRANYSSKAEPLRDCSAGVECWFSGPNCSDPSSNDRDFGLYALAGVYGVSVTVGLDPDERRRRCEGDQWAKPQAFQLFRDTLAYVLGKEMPAVTPT